MKTSELNEIWDLLWAEPSSLDSKDAFKAKAFRRILVDGFKKKLNPAPPIVDQQKIARIRERVWENYQKKLKPELPDKLIIILLLSPLEKSYGGAGGCSENSSIASLKTEEDENYIEENDSVLMSYRGDDGWYLSFRTEKEALIDNNVLLIIKDNQGKEIIREIIKLEEDDIDEVWEFKYPLPNKMKLDKSYAIEVRYLDSSTTD